MLTKDDVQNIAHEVVKECRLDVDKEIAKLHQADHDNAWTEVKAEAIAKMAAEMAVKKITEDFYMGVGKKTITAIGAATVASVILARDYLKSMIGMK